MQKKRGYHNMAASFNFIKSNTVDTMQINFFIRKRTLNQLFKQP